MSFNPEAHFFIFKIVFTTYILKVITGFVA